MGNASNKLVWLFMIGIIIYLAYHFTPYQIPKSKVLSDKTTEVTVTADNRGHFVFHGEINGQRVNFLYDTGATLIAIPENLANKMNLPRGRSYYSHTANGRALSYETILREVKVGAIVMRNVRGSIATGLKGNQLLLGMSFLNDIESVRYKGTLTLRVR